MGAWSDCLRLFPSCTMDILPSRLLCYDQQGTHVSGAKKVDYFHLTIHRANPEAYESDHGVLVQCMFQGMNEAITSVHSL